MKIFQHFPDRVSIEDMEFRKQSNCVYHCRYHIILTSKYRRKIFNNGVQKYMEKTLLGLKKYYPEIDIEKINHDLDHIHLLVWIPPKMSVGSVIRIIKSNSAKDLKKKFPFLKEVYWGTASIWSGGYFVSTVGVDQKIIEKYIDMQGQEDAGQAKLEL